MEAIQCLYEDAPEDPENPAQAGAYQLWVRYRGAGHEQNQTMKCITQFAPGTMLDTLVQTANKRQKEDARYYAYANSDWYTTTQTMWYTKNLHRGAKSGQKCQKRRDMMWDIDDHSLFCGMSPQYIADIVDVEIRRGTLPPVVVVITGRGVQLHLPITPCNPRNLDNSTAFDAVYKAVSDRITENITSWHKELKLDNTSDDARLHRIPGTYNTGAHTYAHVDPRHASAVRRDVKEIAKSLGVASEYNAVRHSEAQIEAAKTAKAVAILLAVTSAKGSEEHKSRYKKALCLAEHLHQAPGNRHNVLFALCSTMLDNGGTVDHARAQAINATFTEPLPEKDVRAIIKLLNRPDERPGHEGETHRPVHTDTLYKMCGVKSWYDDGDGNHPQPPMDVLKPPEPHRIYSKREVRWAIGYLKELGGDTAVLDTRKQNRARDEAAAKRKAENTSKKERARQMVAGGESINRAAKAVGIAPTTLSTYISKWNKENQ